MNIRIFDDMQQASAAGAEVIAQAIAAKPDTVLGLATGSTPVAMYKELIRMNKAGEVDFAKVRSYNLDEYIGLDGTHDQSYRYFMDDNLFNHINIDKANTHVPCGTGADHAADAKHYDEMIEAAGGIDVQVLGIGNNGHIGFNEPDTVFHKGTHVVDLTDSTIDAKMCIRDRPPEAGVQDRIAAGQIKVWLAAIGEAHLLAVADDGQHLFPRHGDDGLAGVFREDIAVLAALVARIGDVPLEGEIRFHGRHLS